MFLSCSYRPKDHFLGGLGFQDHQTRSYSKSRCPDLKLASIISALNLAPRCLVLWPRPSPRTASRLPKNPSPHPFKVAERVSPTSNYAQGSRQVVERAVDSEGRVGLNRMQVKWATPPPGPCAEAISRTLEHSYSSWHTSQLSDGWFPSVSVRNWCTRLGLTDPNAQRGQEGVMNKAGSLETSQSGAI